MNNTTQKLLSLPQRDFFNSHAIVLHEVESAIEAHSELYKMYKRRESYFDGEQSKTLEERKKSGLGWMDCWNFGKSQQEIKSIVLRNCRIFKESLFLSHPQFFAYEKRQGELLSILGDESLSKVVGEHIAYSLGKALSVDSRINDFLMQVEYPSLTFGWSVVQARKEDWLPEVFHPKEVAFPAGTKVNDVRRWFTFAKINAQDLYAIWAEKRNEVAIVDEDSESGQEYHIASSYVLEGIEEALWSAFKDKYDSSTNPKSQYKSFSDIVDRFSEKCQTIIQSTDDINICKMFNREMDKSLSETWIVYNKDSTNATVEGISSLLFKKNHGQIQQDKAQVIVKDSGFTDDGLISKLGGISKLAVENGLRYDMARNQLNNKLKLVGMPYLQTNSSRDDVTNKIKVTSGFGVLMDGASFVEHQPNFDLSSHINLLNYQEREYAATVDEYNTDPTRGLSSRPTKDEVGLAASTSQGMKDAKFTIKMPDYARVVMMMLNGLCEAKMEEGDAGYNAQKVFFAELINKLSGFGFDTKEKCVKLIRQIMTMPVDYYGMSLDTLKTLMTIAETPQSRIRIKRMMLLRMGVPTNEIELHAPYEQTGYRTFEDDALIAIENNMFATTSDVVYSDSHDPITHAAGHLNKVVEIMEGVNNGELDAIVAFKWISNILAHNEKHIAYLENHPFYSSKYDAFADAQKAQTKNALALKEVAAKQAKDAQEARQQQSGELDPVQAAKINELQVKAQAKAEREQFLTINRMKTKEAQRAFDNSLKMSEQQQKMKINEEAAAQKNRILLLQAAAKLLK